MKNPPEIDGDILERAEKRFWIKVGKTFNCWEWLGFIDTCGRGRFWWKNKARTASRVSWEIHYGTIKKNFCVLHRCDNPACVKPSHLFLGTIADNMKDMVLKGRSSLGEKNGRSMLSKNDVIIIRKRYGIWNTSQKKLADEYKVSRSHISEIINHRKWKHI